jgi:hypothetical protein
VQQAVDHGVDVLVRGDGLLAGRQALSHGVESALELAAFLE